MNHHNLLLAIRSQIDEYKGILVNPSAISEMQDYKYYVGLIRGLEGAYDFIEKDFKNRG